MNIHSDRNPSTNPYLIGKEHGTESNISRNPFIEFSARWGLYNAGFNSIRNRWVHIIHHSKSAPRPQLNGGHRPSSISDLIPEGPESWD